MPAYCISVYKNGAACVWWLTKEGGKDKQFRTLDAACAALGVSKEDLIQSPVGIHEATREFYRVQTDNTFKEE